MITNIYSGHIANSDLNEAKFSEEHVAIIDYKHIFRSEEDQDDLEEYYEDSKVDDWQLEKDRVNEGHKEELSKEDNNNGGNNCRDWSEEMESISQRLREQYIKGLSGIEEGHS